LITIAAQFGNAMELPLDANSPEMVDRGDCGQMIGLRREVRDRQAPLGIDCHDRPEE
jgi:hypothetical protein